MKRQPGHQRKTHIQTASSLLVPHLFPDSTVTRTDHAERVSAGRKATERSGFEFTALLGGV